MTNLERRQQLIAVEDRTDRLVRRYLVLENHAAEALRLQEQILTAQVMARRLEAAAG